MLNVESNFDLFILLHSVLGKRLGKSMRLVAKEVKEMSQQDILRFEEARKLTIAGHTLELTDIKVSDLILCFSLRMKNMLTLFCFMCCSDCQGFQTSGWFERYGD